MQVRMGQQFWNTRNERSGTDWPASLDFSETFGSVGMLVFEIIVHILVLLYGATAIFMIVKVKNIIIWLFDQAPAECPNYLSA